MVILKKFGPHNLIFFEDYFAIYNDELTSRKIVKIPEPQIEPHLLKSLEEVLKPENKTVNSVCTSRDAEYLGIILQNRQVVIYDSDFNLVSNILSKRAASKAVFTNCNVVLIADKTGDVYLYKFKDKLEPSLLLGHLSMLLDIAISDCGKYVVTCDRDEKIRVSSYPNAYNIVSYCLGHKEFVSHLVILDNVLLSASGDGTIRFWDFLIGKEIFMLSTNNNVEDRNIVDRFCKEMVVENVIIEALPVIDMQVFEDILAVTLLGCKGIQLYHIDRCDEQIGVKFLQNLATDLEIVAFNLCNELLVFTEVSLRRYKYNNTNFMEVSSINIKEVLVNDVGTLNNKNITTLYKRKVDNLQEYFERKKLRLENKT